MISAGSLNHLPCFDNRNSHCRRVLRVVANEEAHICFSPPPPPLRYRAGHFESESATHAMHRWRRTASRGWHNAYLFSFSSLYYSPRCQYSWSKLLMDENNWKSKTLIKNVNFYNTTVISQWFVKIISNLRMIVSNYFCRQSIFNIN